MRNKVNFVAVGSFLILMFIGLVWGIFLLSKDKSSKQYNPYLVYASESVAGLIKGASVKYNGVEVGFVENIDIDDNNLQNVRLLLKISKGTPITESTYATIMSQGITGIAYVGLKSKTSYSPLLTSDEGMPVIKSGDSLFVEIDKAIGKFSNSFENINKSIDKLITDDNASEIKQILVNIENITKAFSNKDKDIEGILENFSLTMKNLSSSSGSLNEFSNNFVSMSDNISRTSDKIGNSSDEFKFFIRNLNNSTLPAINQSIRHLNNILINVEKITMKLESNPSLLLRENKVEE